jgi:branched-chain amino acid transport system permease protein
LLLPEKVDFKAVHVWLVIAVIAVLFLVPVYAQWSGQSYYVTLVTRMMIYGIAATSLNLLVGYTGLVSLGHALFLGIGAYAVGIPAFHGMDNGWLQLLLVVATTAVVGALTGLVVLRTQGMAFIMITLAFAQMFFYLGVSLKEYGGDDGMSLPGRSRLPPFDFESNGQLYYFALTILLATLYLSWRLVHSRFGYVLRGIKSNERRMKALGFSTVRYKLAIYVVAGVIAGVAGFLLANLSSYVSPSSSAWTISGELVVMVILGGIGTVFGGALGALALLLIEELLSSLTEHWMAVLGLLIVAIVLIAKNGIYGSIRTWSLSNRRRATAPPAPPQHAGGTAAIKAGTPGAGG